MSMLEYQLLVTDIDGTLLTNDKQIPTPNLRSIFSFRQVGGLFTLATGRSYTESKRYINQLDLDLPVILCNGAILFEPATQKLNPISTLEDDLLHSILKEMRQLNTAVDLFVYTLDTFYATHVSPLAQKGMDSDDFRVEWISSFDRLPKLPWIKIVAVADHEDMHQLQQWSAQSDFPVEFVQSSDHYFEVLPQGVSKGAAVKKLAENLDLDLSQTATIGDHCNDLSMIRVAGLSAAVSNAHPELLQAAKVIVPSNNESGVSYFIRNYLLKAVQTVRKAKP
mgnify:FL=1